MIKKAQPNIVIWENLTWKNPNQANPELFKMCDILCPNTQQWVKNKRHYTEKFLQEQKQGRDIWLYSCSGPGKLYDPYSYHRLQQWFCVKYNAKGSGFWSFTDSSGSSPWNEYLSKRGSFSPLFINKETVTPGKHMEAIREGVEDYEYMKMLQERIELLTQQGSRNPHLLTAKSFLKTAANRVTDPVKVMKVFLWQEQKDRTIADTVRIEALELLVPHF